MSDGMSLPFVAGAGWYAVPMPETGPPTSIVLDHIAIAAAELSDLWPRYAGDLGGGWVGMGPDAGFSFCQLRFGNGRRIEMLDPHGFDEHDPGKDDFLVRFLERN